MKRLAGVRELLLAGDGDAFVREVGAMNQRCERLGAGRGTALPAELLNRTLVLLMDQPVEQHRDGLAMATDLVAEFREESRQPVPAVHQLAIELARVQRMDVRTLCIYQEFLACSGYQPDSEPFQLVDRVYRLATGPAASGTGRGRKRRRH